MPDARRRPASGPRLGDRRRRCRGSWWASRRGRDKRSPKPAGPTARYRASPCSTVRAEQPSTGPTAAAGSPATAGGRLAIAPRSSSVHSCARSKDPLVVAGGVSRHLQLALRRRSCEQPRRHLHPGATLPSSLRTRALGHREVRGPRCAGRGAAAVAGSCGKSRNCAGWPTTWRLDRIRGGVR